MSATPLVSIIVPVYNIADYVADCLKSLLAQSYSNLEIIVINDGSSDNSAIICDEFAHKHPRITVCHIKNSGLSNARNYGIKKSHGEFIALVDGDDSVAPSYIKAMLDAATSHSADIVVCGYQSNAEQIYPPAQSISGSAATTQLLVSQENYDIVAWNKLYRRTLFKDIKYPAGQLHEDSLTTYKLLATAKTVTYIQKPLYHYRIRTGSIMHQADEINRLKSREQAAHEAIHFFKTSPDLRQAAEVSLLLAKYAFLDAAIAHHIPKHHYYYDNLNWIKSHSSSYRHNPHLTNKLRLYNFLTALGLYKFFRLVRHS